MTPMQRRAGPLAGVRVADFTWIGAGAYATKILADAGADVIKVESATRLDSLRTTPPKRAPGTGVERSGYFADRNTNKRSITLDLKRDEGRDLALALIARSDVVANNFSPDVMAKLGLGYDQCRAVNPSIVYLAMSMQGSSGPERDYIGYGLTMSALTGLHALTGEPGGVPSGTGTNYPDHVPNPTHAAFATLLALRHRRRTGEGQFIDLAQTEPMICMLAGAVMQEANTSMPAAPQGNRHPSYAPHGVYPCRGTDTWIALAVRNDVEWRAACGVLGIAQACVAWDLEQRRHGDTTIATLISAQTSLRDADDLMTALQASGVPAGVLRDARAVVDDDPQLHHRGHWLRLDHPVMGESLYNAPPFRMRDDDFARWSPAPLLGQHTDEVLTDILGLDAARVRTLRESGVLT